MKSVLIDIGNSAFCKTVFTDGGSLCPVRRVGRDCLCSTVAGAFDGEEKADVICMSTVAERDAGLESFLRSRCRKLICLDAFTPMPLKVDYDTPGTLGSDRIAAAVGAQSLFPGEDCLIFDFGTALTVDFLSGTGVFLGGNISPGLGMRFSALHRYTSRLPLTSPSVPGRVTGKSTTEALDNGIVLGIMFEEERYINDNPGRRVIFTGGEALFFAKMSKTPIFVACNLVLAGLYKIAQFNV